MGIEQSRRDDLESLGYTMVYLLKGVLPWTDIAATTTDVQRRLAQIRDIKLSTSTAELCSGLPEEVSIYFDLVRSMTFEEKPDYHTIRSLFRHLMVKEGITADYIYDWVEKVGETDGAYRLPVLFCSIQSDLKYVVAVDSCSRVISVGESASVAKTSPPKTPSLVAPTQCETVTYSRPLSPQATAPRFEQHSDECSFPEMEERLDVAEKLRRLNAFASTKNLDSRLTVSRVQRA
jgi:hypothetical protein